MENLKCLEVVLKTFNDRVLFEVNNNAISKTVNVRRRLWTTPYEDV